MADQDSVTGNPSFEDGVNLLGIFRNGASRRRSEPRLRDGVLEIFLPTSTLLAR